MNLVDRECFACRASPRSRGVLCASCAAGLVADGLCPEQIASTTAEPAANLPSALLIDGFGVIHVLVGREVCVGRSRKSDVCVAEGTVSVDHAILEHREKSNVWFVADRRSDNGTRVNDEPVERRFPLEPLDRVFVGRRVGFVFVPLDAHDPAQMEDARAEVRSQRAASRSVTTKIELALAPRGRAQELKVRAATEGGAVAAFGDERVQLSELEYELLCVLARRFVDEGAHDASVRGFIPGEALIEMLSFRSEAPSHANLRGVVRKLRRKLADLDVIESRKGLGYRLVSAIDVS
jgi:hypothetical protein